MKIKKLQSGVTFVELIIAVSIILIMASAIFVIRKPSENKGKIELTKSTIELLCAAIEQYHSFYNEFPDPNNTNIGASGYYPVSDLSYTERLSYRLGLCPEAQTVLNQINPKMRDKSGRDDCLKYVDAWNMEFRYEYTKKENWNFPRITSAGPDKDFNTNDDITSRK